ncbi:hypothetical protein M752DRAFT_300621 [Aspergillus phoenicis ATCC 13157]|uniref:Uncharacterized protein n=1 Tax=Aspergillus phoenicis ATCC 13157 TaxID=1353007 RepID=A0A370PJM9_ASPPH|nr:hypothetical protein M752DRAFT_300621 [Aspergillus phoenicis ATCC 13157]
MSSYHYVRIPHCALCGQRFDKISSFCSVIIRDSPDRDILVTRSLTFHGDTHTIYLEDLGVHIHDYRRKKARHAPSVHSLCMTAGMDLPSPHIIHNLGLAMVPLIMTGLPQEIYRISALSEAVDSLLRDSHDMEVESMLSKLLRRFRDLPLELTMIIWDFLASGPVRCLLALNSSKNIWSDAPLSAGSATISLSGEIVVYFTHLTKENYVCGIRQGHILYGHGSSSFTKIQIPTSNAMFVFSQGIYGLQKLEFLTETGTSPTSETDPDGRRFISVIPYQRELPVRVDIEWDVLKISLISPHNKSVFGHDFIWVPPVPCSHLRWLSPKRFYDWPRHFDFAIQPQRFMTYVPLKRDKRLYGITAFCSSEGFVGLGTHFCSYSYPDFRKQDASVYWYGKQQGYPIHIQLDYSDNISSVHVYWHQSDALSGSYLAVKTIRNRIFVLGPQFPPSKTAMKNIFDSDDGEILGLYYDASPGITKFTSLGTDYSFVTMTAGDAS